MLESIEGEEVLVEEELISAYIVDTKGEVKYPGIYEVESNYGVYDVVELAGGLIDMAATTTINFAQKIRDLNVLIICPNNVILEQQ